MAGNIKGITIALNGDTTKLDTDRIGNHTNVWTDYYTCKATISGEGADEERDAGAIQEKIDLSVTVRCCRKANLA